MRLPVIVNLDGYYLSFTREPVELPEQEMVRQFLPAYADTTVPVRAGDPVSQGVAVLGGSQYSYFRYETHTAARNGLTVFKEISEEFAQLTGRSYPLLEEYRAEDAEIVFFMIGFFATKAKAAIDSMRMAGHRVGLVRPRLLRPFPDKDIIRVM